MHADQELHREMNLFLNRLDEQQRRWYAAVESKRTGAARDRLLSQITGLDTKTVQRGRRELVVSLTDRQFDRTRHPGSGRHKAEKQRFEAANCSIIRVDTKKKELVGNYKMQDKPGSNNLKRSMLMISLKKP